MIEQHRGPVSRRSRSLINVHSNAYYDLTLRSTRRFYRLDTNSYHVGSHLPYPGADVHRCFHIGAGLTGYLELGQVPGASLRSMGPHHCMIGRTAIGPP